MSTNKISTDLSYTQEVVLQDLVEGKLPTVNTVQAETIAGTNITAKTGFYIRNYLNPLQPEYALIMAGNGDPNTKITAYVGSLYLNMGAQTANTVIWVKTSGSNTNTGWTPFESA